MLLLFNVVDRTQARLSHLRLLFLSFLCSSSHLDQRSASSSSISLQHCRLGSTSLHQLDFMSAQSKLCPLQRDKGMTDHDAHRLCSLQPGYQHKPLIYSINQQLLSSISSTRIFSSTRNERHHIAFLNNVHLQTTALDLSYICLRQELDRLTSSRTSASTSSHHRSYSYCNQRRRTLVAQGRSSPACDEPKVRFGRADILSLRAMRNFFCD